MARWQATGTDLAISALVAVAVVALLLVWYPGPLYEAGGSERLTVILMAIDIQAMSILTLLVFRAGKLGMKFDLAVVALPWAALLAYGLSVISAARGRRGVHHRPLRGGRRQPVRGRSVGRGRPGVQRLPCREGDLECFPKYYVPYAE